LSSATAPPQRMRETFSIISRTTMWLMRCRIQPSPRYEGRGLIQCRKRERNKSPVTLRLDITLGTDSEEPSLCSGDKGIVRAIELLDHIQRQVLQPADKGKPKLLRRFLGHRHDVFAQLLGPCNDGELGIFRGHGVTCFHLRWIGDGISPLRGGLPEGLSPLWDLKIDD